MAVLAVVPSPAVTAAPLYVIEDQLAVSVAAKSGAILAGAKGPVTRLRSGVPRRQKNGLVTADSFKADYSRCWPSVLDRTCL